MIARAAETRGSKQREIVEHKVNEVSDAMKVTFENLDDFLAGGHVRPIHPGPLFRSLVIEGSGRGEPRMTVRDVAEKSGISREMLHRILRGDASITPKTAIGLAEASGTQAEYWLHVQRIFDLWNERQKRNQAPAPKP